ncbi:ABC transporter permease subunit [Fictibacillus fluitans]|uniref:ABC transporter permease subunit n=1 Tax=Fictibacillus fluitans TaxID=3058422 RepID=A0ABT8HW51_9BACL|nr:ABC transporter permease subunit [Fictibacillus sp. NE201]MDN4524948.1 ABC transporter permease subunit [Fictibacillus sp. NE201]
MNIFWRELRSSRKSMIWWCIGLLFMVVSGMSKYDTMKNSGQSVNEIFGAMPKSLQAIFGLSSLDLTTITGYFGMLFSYLALMAAIHAALLGSTMITKEERDKTSEFLLAKPVSRTRIVASKLAASLILLLLFNLVTYGLSAGMVNYYEPSADLSGIGRLMAGMLILQLIFLSVGMAVAAVSLRPKSTVSIATGILVIAYILSIAIELNDKLDALRFITPFKYFEAKKLVGSTGFEGVYIWLSAAIILGAFVLTFAAYRKRDLKI